MARRSASSVRATGTLPQAESAQSDLVPEQAGTQRSAGFAMLFLLLRAFSSGCAALTGVEAISNGVPAFKKPKSRNAATTLLLMGVIAVTMLMSIITLARMDRHQVRREPGRPSSRSTASRSATATSRTRSSASCRHAVFSGFPLGVVFVSIVTGLILILAANTAFNGFPVLGSILAKDGYLPRQLHTRGDRLAFSNGILILAGGRDRPDHRCTTPRSPS